MVELKDGLLFKSAAVLSYRAGKLTGYQSAKRARRAVQPYLTPADPAPEALDIERQLQLSARFTVGLLIVHAAWLLLLYFVEK